MHYLKNMKTFSWKILIVCYFQILTQGLDFGYHNYITMTKYLKDFNEAHPNLTRLYSIGTSVEKRELWVIEVTASDRTKALVPNVKLVANIHGNEAVGKEVLLHFVEYLVLNYERNTRIGWLLNTTRIHVLPSMNPDGFEKALTGLCKSIIGRENARNVDLNRNFPDYFRAIKMARQPESLAVDNWMNAYTFVLSASLHGGAMVANYPFESAKENHFGKNMAPDDDVLRHLALVYASNHPTMKDGCPEDKNHPHFDGGITNGAAWYIVNGGMQDFNYAFRGCMEITLEISCCKYPSDLLLPKLWMENREALIQYVSQVRRGVKGTVIDKITKMPIPNAVLKIDRRSIVFRTDKNGEFWRILLPGWYDLEVDRLPYEKYLTDFEVIDYGNNFYSSATQLTIEMSMPQYATEKTGKTLPYATSVHITEYSVGLETTWKVENKDNHLQKSSGEINSFYKCAYFATVIAVLSKFML